MLSHQVCICDAHTHCFPRQLEQSPRAWAQQHQEPHWANLVAPIGRPTIQGWSDLQQMLAHMDAAGVEKPVFWVGIGKMSRLVCGTTN